MALQVLEALGIKKAYALGTSQGGWLVARMALLAPDVVCFFYAVLNTVLSRVQSADAGHHPAWNFDGQREPANYRCWMLGWLQGC